MKTHKFDVDDAVKYGVNKAILLEHLRFHQSANEGNPDLEFDGKPYAFIKPSTIKNMYPYFSYASVRRWLNELEDDGVIKSIKPEKEGGYHLTYFHVFKYNEGNSQSDSSNSQSENSYNSQSENSSIVTNVNSTKCKYIRELVENDLIEEIKDPYILMAVHIWKGVHDLKPDNHYTKTAKIEKWRDPIRLMIEKDELTLKRIWRLWKHIQRDNFWRKNVLSPEKLREKFGELEIKLLTKDQRNGNSGNKTKADNAIDFLTRE